MRQTPNDYLNPYEWARIGSTARTPEEAWRQIEDRLVKAGFDKPVFLSDLQFRPAEEYPSPPAKLGTMLSQDWETFCYENPELVVDDPVRNRIVRSEGAFDYVTDEPGRIGCNDGESRVLGIYRDHGLLAGAHYVVHDRERSALSVLCLGETRDPQELLRLHRASSVALQLATAHFAEGLTVRKIADSSDRPPLSPREAECLRWASVGRSSKQIADRLRLSESTVNEYFASAIRKLGASSRAHACARAFLLSRISP